MFQYSEGGVVEVVELFLGEGCGGAIEDVAGVGKEGGSHCWGALLPLLGITL